MLRFFRQIRKTLMEQNKVRTYLLYAIGEIFLVVIGILIALQVNNWNQDRIENNELIASLNSIAKNMEQDIEAANNMIAVKDSASVLALEYLNLKNTKEVEPERFFEMIEAIFVEDYININESGFEALKSSGLLGKLRDTEFETLIYQYYDSVNEARDQEISTNEFIEAMEAEAGAKGTFKNLFELYVNPEIASEAFFYETIQIVLDDPAVSAAAGRVAIQSNLFEQYKAMIETGSRFIEFVGELE